MKHSKMLNYYQTWYTTAIYTYFDHVCRVGSPNSMYYNSYQLYEAITYRVYVGNYELMEMSVKRIIIFVLL